LEKVPPTKVKGKKQPLQLYRVHWERVQSVVPQSSSQRTNPL
jgi:hypothetical protein